MDLDLAEYDQVDEAKYFMEQKSANPTAGGDLLTTLSSEQTGNSYELTNCENDYVFLPGPPPPTLATPATNLLDDTTNNLNNTTSSDSKQDKAIAPDQLDIRSHQPASMRKFSLNNSTEQHLPPTTTQATFTATKQTDTVPSSTQQRASHPLMAINSNGAKNPFYNPQQVGPESGSAAGQSFQPFWMRPDNYANKPIGPLEVPPSASSPSNPVHLSDLMHQIVTKSDSIYIAIPCVFCHEPKACPPSDISAWVNHMNRAHNCKLCPICNKLIGLGPMRDIEIMRKHVVGHIDEDWLERRSPKTNFSFGLQNQWFASGRCTVKDPRTLGPYKN